MTEFYRVGGSIKGAILTIIKYIRIHTGTEPSQEELAELLKSYFILNEVGNQIKYQLKLEETDSEEDPSDDEGPFWRLDLKNGPGVNTLASAGIFHRSIKEAIDEIRRFMKKTIGIEPDYDIIAKSLISSFILSEIKSQYDYQRRQK